MKRSLVLLITLAVVMVFAQSVHAQLYWSLVSPAPTSNNLYSVAYGNGQYVAVGANNTILTSPDGIAWTPATSPTYTQYESVIFGSSGFVAAGEYHYHDFLTGPGGTPYYNCHLSTHLISSADGLSWTARVSTGGGAFGPFFYYGYCSVYDNKRRTSIAFGNGRYAVVVGGTFLVSYSCGLMSSTDAINWSYLDQPPGNFLTWEAYKLSSYGNGLFVATGGGGNIKTSPLTPIPGWTSRTSGTTRNLNLSTYSNGYFLVTGDSGTLITSPDGTTWTSQTSGIINNLKYATYSSSGQYVAVGDSGIILNSPDGVNWALNSSGSVDSLNSVAADSSGQFVVVGNNGTIIISSSATASRPFSKNSAVNTVLKVNISNSLLSISLPSSMLNRALDLAVYSASGREIVIKRIRSAADRFTMSVPNLAVGAYVLSVKDRFQKKAVRFVITR
jgi:hypothetical protein